MVLVCLIEFKGNLYLFYHSEMLRQQMGIAIGYLEVPNTGSLNNFEEVTIDVTNITDKKDLFFIFAGEGFQFDAWSFK